MNGRRSLVMLYFRIRNQHQNIMPYFRKFLFMLALSPFLLLGGCEDGLNLFSIQDDLALGERLHQEIQADPGQFPVIPRNSNVQAYQYLENIRDKILNSGNVKYKNEFAWQVFIVDDDSTLNAFCAPGGYIYVYTGLIKFLDSEDQLAGVLGHEIAHADRRHSTKQLTKLYGIQLLLDIVLGENQGDLTNIAAGLIGLEFSRANEREADEYSVKYLCGTDYYADGASDFFEKMVQSGQGGNGLTFLSTHPDPGNRVQDIRNLESTMSCAGSNDYATAYQQFKALF